MIRVAPSILSADFANLARDAALVAGETDIIHVDVMDGHFVPNITLGPPIVRSLRAATHLYLDCHLMISEPAKYLEAFREAGANGCTVHVEVGNTMDHIKQMRDLGLDVGVSLNPDVSFETVEPFLEHIDLLLLMTVFPGFGGQKFIEDVIPKIEQAAQVIRERELSVTVEIDGGIDVSTAPRVAAAGATLLVAGSAVYGKDDPSAAIRGIKAAVSAAK